MIFLIVPLADLVSLPGFVRCTSLFHRDVRLRFKLASGLGVAWKRDGGIPQGCPLSMVFIIALYYSLVSPFGVTCWYFPSTLC